jgi:hypothetical protein
LIVGHGGEALPCWDYPYQYEPEEVAAQDAMSVEDKKAFFQTNAEKVFGL